MCDLRDDTMPEGEVLERGARVLLRRFVMADQEEYFALRRESREFLRPWEPRPPEGVDPETQERFRALAGIPPSERAVKAMIARCGDGVMLGQMSMNEIVRGSFQSTYLGCWIGAPHARRGYTGEALQLALRHAFESLGLHRVEANIQPHNAASLALVRRAGFRREGFSPRYLKIDGQWADHERWALRAEEWAPAPRSAR